MLNIDNCVYVYVVPLLRVLELTLGALFVDLCARASWIGLLWVRDYFMKVVLSSLPASM